MDLLKGHLYDFANPPSTDDTKNLETTAYFTLESFKDALKLGDHVFYNNMKLPIWFKPHLFELSHHGVYVGVATIPEVKQNIVLVVDPVTNKRATEEKVVRPAMDVPAILHVWPGKKKDKNSDLQYTSLEDFFNTALRTESAAYIIRDNSLGDDDSDQRKAIVAKCKNFHGKEFEFDHLKNNCENFVNSCLYDTKTEKMKSKQVESYKKLETKLIKGAIAATAGVVGVGVAAKMLHNKKKNPSVTTPRTASRTTPRPKSSSFRGGGRRHPSRRHPSRRTPSRRNPSPRRNRNHKRSSSRRTPNRRKAQKCR